MLHFTVTGLTSLFDTMFDAEAIALCREYRTGGFPTRQVNSADYNRCSYIENKEKREFFVKFHALVSKHYSSGPICEGWPN